MSKNPNENLNELGADNKFYTKSDWDKPETTNEPVNLPTSEPTKIKSFRVTFTADHAQYYPGHGLAFTHYTHTGGGCAETLREAFEEALDDLHNQNIVPSAEMLLAMQSELIAQLREPVGESLDIDIVQAECPRRGEHESEIEHTSACNSQSENGPGDCDCAGGHENHPRADCAVCAGEWHFYVNVDVEIEGSK